MTRGWLALLLLASATPVFAQDSQPVEIPFTSTLGFGARALGMGQAHLAVVEDLSAIYYNPAGLAQVRRIEVGGTLTFDRREQKVVLSGTPGDVTLRNTHLNSIGFAYPFPTYRGSLVIGGAYNRNVNLNSDYLRQGSLPPYASNETESILEEGSLDTWTAAGALDVSPDISIGGAVSYISGSTDRRDDFMYNDPEYDYLSRVDETADLSGWTGSFGALVRLGPLARLGLQVRFPQSIDLQGTQVVRDTLADRQTPANGYSDDFLQHFDDHIDLPFSFGAGIALTPRNFVLAADVRYTDWTQIRYSGPVRVEYMEATQSGDSVLVRQDAYRGATEFHVGAEYMLPFYPLRLRAGFYTEPVAYNLVLTDVFGGVYRVADFNPDRRFFTFGVGALLEDVLTVDVAFVTGKYERSAVEVVPHTRGISVSEEQDLRRVYVTTSFRF
jgi:long-chain fatty acid transport protein